MSTVHDLPNPQIISLARQARGLTQTELASRVGVAASLISRWENGVAPAPPDKVELLASGLAYPVSLFYRPERVAGSDSVCFHHRKRKSMSARLLDRTEGLMHLAQLQMKRLLDDLAVEAPYSLMTLDPAEDGGPGRVAETLRAYWRLPSGPIRNLTTVIENAGAIVLFHDFGTPKLDGMSCWSRSTPPLFFINSELSVDRKRWTIAHELGHLVMHATPPDEDQEEQGEEFAREFLLPSRELQGDLRRLSFQRLPSLKQQWRVPMKELITAASRRGLLPPQKIKSISVQYSRAGWQTAEAYDLDPEEPTLASEAVRVHQADGATIEQLGRLTDLLAAEFETLYGQGRRLRAV